MLLKTLTAAAVTCLALFSHAADKSVEAMPVKDGEIKLDGVLDEAVWQKAAKHGGFTRWKFPETKAAEETAFQVAASENGLYWAFDVTDKNIVSTIKTSNGGIYREDDIEMFITGDDPIPDDPNVHTSRQLIFSPAGISNDISHLAGISDSKWTSDWKVATKRTATGYTAEVFIPYYALNIVNTHNKNFNFNIARHNVGGNLNEYSVFSPTGRFTDQTEFAALKLPFNDFTRYQWKLGTMELKTVPAAKGTTQQVLKGSLTGKTGGPVILQATARQEGKIVTFNRIKLNAAADKTMDFTMPLAVGASGNYDITLTARSGKEKVFYTTAALKMEAVPFKLVVNNPFYRKSIFPDQLDKVISISIDYQTDAKNLKGVKTALTVTGDDNKVIAQAEKTSGAVRTFTVNAADWQPGKYTFTVKSSGSEALKGSLQEVFTVVEPHKKGNTVHLGKAREVFLNGKRFFPRGFLAVNNHKPVFYKEIAEAGYNTVHFYTLNQRKLEDIKFILDEAHKYNLKVFFYPYANCKIGFSRFTDNVTKKSGPRITPEAWERMKTMVNTVKEHPAFLGWYLADEPKGEEFCAELRNVYKFLRELDPHHPVIHLDFTAEGCINKREGYADLHILDMYPHPLTDGSWQRSISSVLYSMKLVNEVVAPYGTWFCPEAFKPRGKKNRSLTYKEIRCLVFGTIVHGATGMVPYKIGDPQEKYYRPVRNSGIFISPEMHLGYLKGIGPELAAMEKVLLEPERLPVEVSDRYIAAMRKKHNNKEFIIAVNSMPDTINCTISGKNLPDGTYRVLGENRTVSVKNGKFSDTFTNYATHIYTNDATYSNGVDIAKLTAEIKKADEAALEEIKGMSWEELNKAVRKPAKKSKKSNKK